MENTMAYTRKIHPHQTRPWIALYIFLAASLGMAILALIWSLDKDSINGIIVTTRAALVDYTATADSQTITISNAASNVTTLSDTLLVSSSVISSGAVRWFSNCQVGKRASDGYDFSVNTLSFAALEGEPESTFVINRVLFNNGMIRYVVVFTPPSEDIQFTVADSTASCKTILATNSSTSLFDIGQGYYYSVSCVVPQDNIVLTPACDGTTCDQHQFSFVNFYSSQENSEKMGYAVMYMWSSSDYSLGDRGESVFVARNISITGNLYCS
jgi:hypothetical protein